MISPATMQSPVVTMVSQATRASGSWARMASRMESEIWSAILSGWPSVTDSEVNVHLVMVISLSGCCRCDRTAATASSTARATERLSVSGT